MNYGWAIVSASDQICGGLVYYVELSHKKQFLRARAFGAIICATERDAEYTQRIINGNWKAKNRVLGRENYFKCRLYKHWVYKPTRIDREFFDNHAVAQVMDV